MPRKEKKFSRNGHAGETLGLAISREFDVARAKEAVVAREAGEGLRALSQIEEVVDLNSPFADASIVRDIGRSTRGCGDRGTGADAATGR